MHSPSCLQRRHGFTLIELLVVVAIIALLIALLLPAVQKVREAANRIRCGNNLHQLGLAAHMYHHDQKGLPSSRLPPPSAGSQDDSGGEGSWGLLLLPYLEQNQAYETWAFGTTYAGQTSFDRTLQLKTYYCPSRREPGRLSIDRPPPGAMTDYAACDGSDGLDEDQTAGGTFGTNFARGAVIIGDTRNGVAQWRPRTQLSQGSIPDGTSNTFLFGEKHVRPTAFGRESDGDTSVYNGDQSDTVTRVAGVNHRLAGFPTSAYNRNFGSYHPGVCQFVLADGSVKAVRNTMDGTTLERLAQRNDGLPVDLSDL